MEMNSANLLWFLAFIILAGGNGFGGLFGGRPMGPAPVTQSELNDAINNQTILTQLGQQNDLMLQTNNTNQINMIQGFNSIVQQLMSQTSQLGQQITNLGYQLDQCCCGIKTQMLTDRLADKTAENVKLQNQIDNRDQTQTILGQLGRFVTWAGSGTPATGATVSA